MSIIQQLTDAYIEAVYFTEDTPDNDNPPDARLSKRDKMHAYVSCRNFYDACRELDIDMSNTAQMGHDLWLTRNRHGVGFWDRPEVYGETNAKILTAISLAMGEHNVEFVSGDEDA